MPPLVSPRSRELKQRKRQKSKGFTGFYLGFIVWGVVPSRLVFTSSTKREIRHYHVGVQWRQRNGPKMHDARAKLLFFHSRGQHLCKFIGTKESVCIRKEFNSHRIGLGHQHGCRFIVLGHQYGVTSCENTLLILYSIDFMPFSLTSPSSLVTNGDIDRKKWQRPFTKGK